mgnify:CR=1 FL=1
MSIFGWHYRLEGKAIGLTLAIIGVASIGGIVEIAPLFTIHQTVESAPDMRVYTPLELAGRNIYIREGCYACHSQMIRTLRDEVERYGPYSLAVESKYDHPMLWGSKRTGPDLARIGGKYSDEWHVAHLNNPRDVVPVSVMPAYSWLLQSELRTDDLTAHLRAQRAVGVPYTDDMIASAAVERLKRRSGVTSYSMARTGDGRLAIPGAIARDDTGRPVAVAPAPATPDAQQWRARAQARAPAKSTRRRSTAAPICSTSTGYNDASRAASSMDELMSRAASCAGQREWDPAVPVGASALASAAARILALALPVVSPRLFRDPATARNAEGATRAPRTRSESSTPCIGRPQNTPRHTRIIASMAPKDARTMTAMTTTERASPDDAAAKMTPTLPHMPENGGKPTMENAIAANTHAASWSRRARPDRREARIGWASRSARQAAPSSIAVSR